LSQKITNLLITLINQKKYQEAIVEAKKYDYDKVTLYNIIAISYKHLSDYKNSIEYYNKSLKIKENKDTFYNLGNLYLEIKKFDKAIENYNKSLLLDNNQSLVYLNLGIVYFNTAHYIRSLKYFKEALSIEPSNQLVIPHIANAYFKVGDIENAIKYYKLSITKDNIAKIYFNIAVSYGSINQNQKAIEYYDKSLAKGFEKPCLIYEAKGSLIKYDKNSNEFNHMQKLYPTIIDLEEKCSLAFALAKVYSDIKDYENEIKYINEGNVLSLLIQDDFSFEQIQKELNFIKRRYKKEIKIPKYKNSNKKVIFILGMPRSGTTLSEKILSSHSSVVGAGELAYFTNHFLDYIGKNPKTVQDNEYINAIKQIRDSYLQDLEDLDFKEDIIIDKMPDNHALVGFILQAIPEAKIVHMQRDPMAICWSMYKTNFSNIKLKYSCDMKTLTTYYKEYKKMMKFWKDIYGDRIYDLNYEKLTENQEEETRKLLQYCQLDWQDSCLDFHKTKTSVRTASSQQVTKKMYKGSSQAWKKYEKYLQPMIKGLQEEEPKTLFDTIDFSQYENVSLS
jgi:tetratricopeptide (TPR) repeat protein